MWVLTVDSIIGIDFYGPFDSNEAAAEYARKLGVHPEDFVIRELTPPENPRRARKR